MILVSRDINLRVIAQGVDLPAEEYENIKVVEAKDKIYAGFEEIVVDDEIIDRFYADKPIFLDEEDVSTLYPNQFLMLVSSSNPKKTCLARFWNHGTNFKRFRIIQTTSAGTLFQETKSNRLLMICFTTMILASFLSSAVLVPVRHSWLLLLVLNKRLEMESQDTRKLLSLDPCNLSGKTLDSCPELLKKR